MKNELIVANRPKSGISEAVKTIRTNLQFSSIDQKVQSILVTSSVPSEGKSFITANLAVAFAQTGSKVLIVDCDMRRGRQHKIFEVENEQGLSNLLIDDVEKKHKKYIQKTKIDNLHILTTGIVPPNPSELLASEKNKQLLALLEAEYDTVIYDGVPIGGLTDSVIMADVVDKIVVVCAYKETKMENLQDTIKGLDNFRNKIAGIVVNKMPVQKNNYYNKYYS